VSEPNYPRVTAADVTAARRDRINNALASFGAGGTAVSVMVAFNAPGGFIPRFITKGVSGIEVRPRPGFGNGPGVVSFPKFGLPLVLLPQPIGFVPGEYYGLKPNIVQDTLGFRMGSKPPFLNPAPERIKVFEAQQAADRIGAQALGVPNDSGAIRRSGFKIPRGRINITRHEFEYLQSLPADASEAQNLIPQLEARQDDFIGGKNNNFNAPNYPSPVPGRSAPITKPEPRGHLVRLTRSYGGSNEAIETASGELIPVVTVGGRVKAVRQ